MISFDLGTGKRLTFAWCPPGQFLQTTRGTSLFRKTEDEVVTVVFTKGFWMATTPVTDGQWQAIMGERFFEVDGFSSDMPVYGLDARMAESFVDKVNNLDLKKCDVSKGDFIFSLPNYLQAKYACRAATLDKSIPFWESDNATFGDFAWYKDNSADKIHEVALKKPSPWGLYDMYGNIYELSVDVDVTISNAVLYDPQSVQESEFFESVGGSYSKTSEDCISGMYGVGRENEYIEPFGLRLMCCAKDSAT